MPTMLDDEENPFRLPPDDQIIRIRDQERQRRAEEREKVKTQKVWEKTTASSRVHKNRRVDDGADDAQLAAEAAKIVRSQRTEGVSRDRREKEHVSDFVKKKREMFLVQMHLDVQKAEILKLDEKAKQKEEALKKSQAMLDEDVTRFDAFLQSNDAKAHQALKEAEDQTKIKNDKIQQIKKLRSQLSAIQSETAKFREQKDECIKFKKFLEKLTPPEWKEQKEQEKIDRKRQRRQNWVNARMAEHKAQEKAEMEAEERALEEKAAESNRGRRRPKREAEEEAKERQLELEARRRKKKYPKQEDLEAEYIQYVEYSSGEEMPLYFEESKQLLDVFTSLEESNLFLIQNSQDTEQILEELQQKYEEIKRSSGATTNKMKQNIAHLEQQIAQENAKCEQLRQELSEKHRSSEQEELLKEVGEKVVEVHSVCVNDKEHDPNTQEMLKSIEAKLEDLLNFLGEVEQTEAGAKQVEALEKLKDGERRKNQRKQRIDQKNRKDEERLRASLQRSQAPIHKKVGKQIMFRSAPLFQERREVEQDDGFEENCKDHSVFGIWINKEGVPNAQKPTRPS